MECLSAYAAQGRLKWCRNIPDVELNILTLLLSSSPSSVLKSKLELTTFC